MHNPTPSQLRGATNTLALLTVMCILPATLRAQAVRGTVSEANGRPVAGAVVTLLDSTSATVSRGLTSESGAFRVMAARAGTYRLRTARIGFRPVLSAPLLLSAGETRVEQVRIEFVPFALDTVRVASRSSCQRSAGDSAALTFALWEQARTALMAAQLTAQSQAITATTTTFERVLESGSRRIRSHTANVRTDMVTQPWRAIALDSLRRVGYIVVEDDGENVVNYFAPDLDVLLAASFLEDHCLSLARRDERKDARAAERTAAERTTAERTTDASSEVGLAFTPIPARRAIAEIAGVVWLDRATSALTRMEFRYVNVPTVRAEQAGGTLAFTRLPSGAWVITRWEIRMPVTYRTSLRAPMRVAELRSNGGELVVARIGTDTLWRRPPLAVSGVLVDSVSGEPLAHARVGLAGTSFQTTSDARGAFTLSDLLPGDWAVDVRTPSLDSAGAVHRTSVTFTDSSVRVRIAVPTDAQLATTLCGTRAAAGTGAVLGTVQVAGDTLVPPNIRLAAEWTEQTITRGRIDARLRRLETRTDSAGRWRLCGVPTEQLLTLRALPASGRAAPVTVRLAPDARFASATLVIDPALPAVASFSGTVVSADSAATPVLDAEVTFPQLAVSARTNARGEFRVNDLPVGPQQLLVRRIGYGALETTVTFTPNESEARRIVLTKVTVLDSVETRAEYVIPSFEENRKVGLGHFLTRDDLAKMENRTLPAVLANFNNVAFRGGKLGQQWMHRARGPQSMGMADRPELDKVDVDNGADAQCYSHVYLDNLPVYTGRPRQPLFDLRKIPPDQIEAIEYYASAAQTPARYSILNSTCGVLVIWTRRTFNK